jgi:hypothetical protein
MSQRPVVPRLLLLVNRLRGEKATVFDAPGEVGEQAAKLWSKLFFVVSTGN